MRNVYTVFAVTDLKVQQLGKKHGISLVYSFKRRRRNVANLVFVNRTSTQTRPGHAIHNMVNKYACKYICRERVVYYYL